MEITLKAMDNGTKATIINLPAGECRQRLEALGLREGKTVTKVSGMPFCGPVCLVLDGRQIAIGHGVASRIGVSAPGDKKTGTQAAK
jgi:ferrous iron transport protein A